MLRFMRKHATGYMIKAMFMLIIIVFIFWGVGSFRGGEKTLAEVGPYKISAIEYQKNYQKLLDFYRMIYREQLDEKMMAQLKLKENVMNQLVDKYLMLVKAEELGVRVSDKEFTEHIAGIEAFKRDDKFNRDLYMEILKRNGVDPKAFEESEKQSLLVSKMLAILQDNGVIFNDRDVRDSYMKERGQVRLGYAVFDPADYKDQVRVQEKEIEDAYEKEKAMYRSENSYHLKYMVIDEKSSIKDDQAYMELLKVKDLTAYAKSKGLEVVDLGNMKESDALSRLSRLKVDTWLKGMSQGDISLPVRDNTKSYIFQVVEKEEGKPLTKEEALKIVRTRMVGERAKMLAKAKAEEAVRDKSTNYAKETGMMSRQSPEIPGLGPIPKENSDLLQLSPDRRVYEKPVDFGGRYYVFSFIGEKQPDEAQWRKEKDAYKQTYAAKKRAEFLSSFREDMKKQVKVKVEWETF
ncbi:MAG TPA: SurA N-terminal domain-containing protein [Syntrophorhabdales bacterium]|nr:SurA N-terminal domain-containing protein [Syntrophorhabdales bacterium]